MTEPKKQRKPRVKRGRPTVLTEESRARLLDALRIGNFRKYAAEYAGISASALRDWLRHGRRQHQGKWRDLYRDVLKAEADAHIRQVGQLMKHAANDPRSTQFFLERKFPEEWGRKDKVNTSGSHVVNLATPEPIEVHAEVKTDEPSRLASILDVLQRAGVVAVAGAIEGVGQGDDSENDGVDDPTTDTDASGVPSRRES